MSKPFFPQLPFEPCFTAPSDQYRRLFGNIPPEQVMAPPVDCILDGQLGALPSASCDPSRPAEHHFSDALIAVARLRAKHLAKGHTPESDAGHGPAFFWNGAHEFYRAALAARDPEKRRKRLVSAAAMLVAMIDCEDFLAQKEPPQ